MNSPSVKKTEKRKRWQNKQNKVFFSLSTTFLWKKTKDPSKGSFVGPFVLFSQRKKVSHYIKPIITFFCMYSVFFIFLFLALQIWGKSTRTTLLSRLSPKADGLANEFWMSLPESFELIQLRNMYVQIAQWAKNPKK